MDVQLKLLVSLQDLDTLIRETSDPARVRELEAMGFAVGGVEKLRASREKLTRQIEKRWLLVYDRVSNKYGRAVVPVEDRTCLGCLMNLPAQVFSEVAAEKGIQLCENCGRILYLLKR
jgi:predicted  nucleic acid-binding Zn-ribbon protein